MKYDHMSPEEAVKAFLDLKAKLFIPMHYGAFRLADDTPHEAVERLNMAWKKNQLHVDQLKISLLGETVFHSTITTKKEEAIY